MIEPLRCPLFSLSSGVDDEYYGIVEIQVQAYYAYLLGQEYFDALISNNNLRH